MKEIAMPAALSPTPRPPVLRRLALAGGGLYLCIIALGLWSELGVRARLIVPDDPAATAANLLAAQGLLALSFAADTLMAMADIALAVVLAALFWSVSPVVAALAAAFRLIQAATIAAALLAYHAALLILQQGGAEAAGAAWVALTLHGDGYDLGLAFFGVNSLLTGWLVMRSGLMPRAIGAGLAAAGLVYLAGSAAVFLAPALVPAIAPAYAVPILAETAMAAGLLALGLRRGRAAADGSGPAGA
jgi:hypothetical protein